MLSEDLDTVMAAIAERAATLVPNATHTELVILAKAAEALRGTVALQSILEAADLGISEIDTSRITSLAAIVSQQGVSQGALTTQQASIVAALEAIRTSYVADMLTVLNSSGNYRIGDMWLAMMPDPNNLPNNVWLLDGSLKSTVDCPLLVNAWGLNSGDTPAPFIANYNASNPYGLTIGVTSNQLRLPNMAGGFLRGRVPEDIGAYQADAIKPHTHPASNGTYITKRSSGGVGWATGTGTQNVFTADADTGNNIGSQTETRPQSYGGVWVVRYK